MQNLTGKKIGRLTVIKFLGFKQYKCERLQNYLCKCDCGNECERTIKSLNSKSNIHSCGCYKKEQIAEVGRKPTNSPKKHGMSQTRIYNIYTAMKYRCYSKNNDAFEYYGARGISVCSEWLGDEGFDHFYEWSMLHGYSDDLTIDRIDNNKNYSPDNCRWVTRKEQMENTRRTRKIVFKGEEHSLTFWAKYFGIPRSTLYYRLERGIPFEKAIK